MKTIIFGLLIIGIFLFYQKPQNHQPVIKKTTANTQSELQKKHNFKKTEFILSNLSKNIDSIPSPSENESDVENLVMASISESAEEYCRDSFEFEENFNYEECMRTREDIALSTIELLQQRIKMQSLNTWEKHATILLDEDSNSLDQDSYYLNHEESPSFDF